MLARLIVVAEGLKISVTMGECYRTQEQQDIYYAKGYTKVTQSKHQDRLAVDLNVYIDGQYNTHPENYRMLGYLWEQLGGRWGGRFGVDKADYETKIGWDAGHFEYAD